MLYEVLVGLAAGVSYAVTGYLKSLKKDGKYEEFDPYKFGQSVLVGVAVGLLSSLTGYSLPVAEQYLYSTGLVALIENVKKAVIRRIF